MMRSREKALASRRRPRSLLPCALDLGTENDVRARLPLLFDLAGETFRLVDVNGVLVAHATICPHWLGPLDQAPVVDGKVRCPWHGYIFDVRSGKCTNGHVLALPLGPAIIVTNGVVRAACIT